MSVVKPMVFWPLTIDSSNRAFIIAAVGTANVATGVYVDAATLMAALQTALNALSPGFTVTVSSSGIVTVSHAAPFTMTGSGSTFGPVAGYYNVDQAAVFNGSSAYLLAADFQHQNGWYPQVPPREDSLPILDRAMNVVTRAVSGQTKFVLEEEVTNRILTFAWLAPAYTFKAYELLSTELNQAVERWFESGYA